MKRRLALLLPLLVLAVVLALQAGALLAQSPPKRTHLEMSVPQWARAGQQTEVRVRLTDETGAPVAKAEVVLEWAAEFMGASGKVVLGKATTDEKGEALIAFTPTGTGEMKLLARFAGDSKHRASKALATLPLRPGGPIYVPTAGVRVPGINVSLLVGILSGVWGTYMVVALLVWLIALKGGEAKAQGREESR